jgi:hypothetical protein
MRNSATSIETKSNSQSVELIKTIKYAWGSILEILAKALHLLTILTILKQTLRKASRLLNAWRNLLLRVALSLTIRGSMRDTGDSYFIEKANELIKY